MTDILKIKNLSIAYEKNIAVDNVSFFVKKGDYLCIVGQNGSGKSTLMKGILGLIPHQLGTVEFTNLKQTEIGYVPQQTAIQKDFPATVYEVVLSGNLNKIGFKPFFHSSFKKKTLETIRLLGIDDITQKSYRELSGGQQQRVLLARALCSTESLLLLDEPVAGLDPLATDDFYNLLESLNKSGMTIIMISHDISSATKQASHILHMNKQAEFFGSSADYFETHLFKRLTGGGRND